MEHADNYRIRSGFGLVLAFAACLVLNACTTVPSTRGGAPEQPLQAARHAAAQGDFAQAARRYTAAARRAKAGDRRNELYLQAALTALRGQHASQAGQVLAAIDPARLNETDHKRYELAQKLKQLAPLPPAQALAQLPPPAGDVPPQLAADIWAARASVLFRQYKYVTGIHSLTQRSVWLSDKQAIFSNDRLIFRRALQAVELGRGSDSPAARDADAVTLGWLRLAEIRKHGPQGGAALQQALQHWEQRFPGHPATRQLLATIFNYQPSTTPRAIARPGQPLGAGPIMLALPLSGQFARAGEAIRAGFETARNSTDAARRLLVVDSANLTARAIVGQARDQGAAAIVGPLAKDKVDALARLGARVPVLALNQLHDGTAPPTFYRYALAPEDDARTAAEHAAEQGWSHALVLVPQDDWGSRVLDSFRDAFAETGGAIVDYARFDSRKVDHGPAVQAVLKRYHAGAAVDFVFIAAEPFHARMLNSQLRFYHAATLPVVATGDIYAGHPDPREDADLNGVAFAAMPWVISSNPSIQALRDDILQRGSIAVKRFPRLFAMGIDAWRLTAEWIANGLQPGTTLPGLTGRLEVLPTGRIRRHLGWARFANGRAELLQPANATNSVPAMQDAPAWTNSAATLESQVSSTPATTTGMALPSDSPPAADTATAARRQNTPAAGHNHSRDEQRQERASEVSRLIDQADTSSANRKADGAPVYTNDGGVGDPDATGDKAQPAVRSAPAADSP